MSSIEKILFEASKKVYQFVDNKADIWIKIKFSIAKYCENLVEDLNTVHIHRSENIYNLESIYVETKLLRTVMSERYLLVNVDVLDPKFGIKYRNAKEFVKQTMASVETSTTDQLLSENKKAIILGSPGAGKSTMLKYCAISNIKEKGVKQIPIYIPMRDTNYLAEGLLKYISRAFSQHGLENADALILELLKDGKLILLLDGLDEVPAKLLAERIEEINNFSTKYKKNRYFVTCRTDSYEGQLQGFKEFEIDVLDDDQIEAFVKKLLFDSKVNPADLLGHISSLPQIKELSSSPLLLSLICIVFERDLHIPSRRTTLYKRCLECLIRDWDAQRNFRRESEYSKFDEEKKLSLLSHIAYKLHSDNKIYFQIEEVQHYVTEIIERFGIETSEVKKLIKEIQSQTGIITQVSRDHMSFSHLTLQEYLTAKYLCENNKLFGEVRMKAKKHFWQEVFILSASILPDASEYLELILELGADDPEITILAAHCLSVDPIADRHLKERIVHKIINYYFNSSKEIAESCLPAIVRMDRTFVGKEILNRLGATLQYLENKNEGL